MLNPLLAVHLPLLPSLLRCKPMDAVIVKSFVDKYTGVSYGEGMTAEFETERAKALSTLGYVKIVETAAKKVVKPIKVVEKAVKVEKTEKKSKKK